MCVVMLCIWRDDMSLLEGEKTEKFTKTNKGAQMWRFLDGHASLCSRCTTGPVRPIDRGETNCFQAVRRKLPYLLD